MARIDQLLAAGRCFSFEFFPPKTDAAAAALERALVELEALRPSFVSITYGAGGSTRDKTHDLVVRILRDTTMTPMAHLTCAAHTRAELADIVGRYRDEGVENILALGGDPPTDPALGLPAGELRHALELVELVHQLGSFSVGVAAHPEVHPRSEDRGSDRQHLAAKLARADFAITQFFFRLDDYLALVDELDALGCRKPVVPGIMPVTNVASIERMAILSGAAVPADLVERLHAVADRPEDVRRVGVEVASDLCEKLLAEGAPGLHFYTLNRSTATREIYRNLRLGSTS